MPQIHCKIYGRVHGVCFRATTANEAERLQLTGWVRNCDDGSVECVAAGPRPELEQLLAWLGHGPSMAHVQRVDHHWSEQTEQFQYFSIV